MQRLSFLLVILLIACNGSRNNDDFIYFTLTDNITKATNDINQRNENLYISLKNQLGDPAVKDKIAVIFPLIIKIHIYSDNIVHYIDSAKRAISIEEQEGNIFDGSQLHPQGLYDSLIHFQSLMLDIDPELSHQFKGSVYISNINSDTSQQSFKKFEQIFLSAKSNQAYIGVLSVLENKIRKFENDMITFCDKKITRHGILGRQYIPLLYQDKSILEGGDSIQITAAFGEITTQNNPEMIVMGKKVSANNTGVMICKVKANYAKGKYPIPVTIDFTDDNTGARATVSKTLYYTIR